MVRFINKFTGTVMYVADDRADEYKAAGHKIAVKAFDPVVPAVRPRKAPAKKTIKK